MPKLKHHVYQFIIAVDQLVNVATLGWADETFSARCWRMQDKRYWSFMCRLVDVIFFWDTKDGMSHCEWAHDKEQKREHMPSEYQVRGM